METDELFRRAERRLGQQIRGKWTLERLLGVGGMAAVYAGTHRNGTRGAIKVLHTEIAMDPELRARFLREGYAANSIAHPGVVRAIDDDEDEGTVYLVMELLEGESIETRADRQDGKLPVSEVLSLMDRVLDVLIAAHAAGVVHRDIKPENVFLTSSGEVKLLDFGIARLGDGSSSRRTYPGATMGTPAYMPPEQARGHWEDVDHRTDLWAVGATMFKLISGHFVHGSLNFTDNELLARAITRQVPTLASVAPDAPATVVALVDRALAFEKTDRWPDALAMQHAVRLAYDALFGKPITTAPRLKVPKDVAYRASGNQPTTAGKSPLGFSRTTLNRYIGQRRSRALAVMVFVSIAIAGFFLMRKATDTPEVSATAAPAMTPEAPKAEPAPAQRTLELSNEGAAVSPSELPLAEADVEPKSAKKAARLAKNRAISRSEPPTTAPAPTAPLRVDLESAPADSPAAPRPSKPAKPHDVLDQQW